MKIWWMRIEVVTIDVPLDHKKDLEWVVSSLAWRLIRVLDLHW